MDSPGIFLLSVCVGKTAENVYDASEHNFLSWVLYTLMFWHSYSLQNERTKFLLYDAKYGKLGGNDPMCALRRDSTVTEEELDEYQIGQLYESQLVQLEKLIAVQRRSHQRAKSVNIILNLAFRLDFFCHWFFLGFSA